MLYNNPPAYRTVIDADVLQALADVENIVAVKESAPDTRRFTDFRNVFGDRFALFAGLDDVALAGLMLGAKGWVSGLTNRSAERRAGKESVSTGRSRWSPKHSKKKTYRNRSTYYSTIYSPTITKHV